jgi:hypothetical protein
VNTLLAYPAEISNRCTDDIYIIVHEQ